jgi:hypothetical protein
MADTGAPKYNPVHAPSNQRVDPKSAGFAVKRPMSTEDRLILAYSPIQVCGSATGSGFSREDVSEVPQQLASRGVTLAEWQPFIKRLERDVAPHQWSLCAWVCTMIWLVPLVCLCLSQAKYHTALRSWIDDLNARLLAPRGMFAKFQTAAIHTKDYHEEISWLAVSLTDEDAALLAAEPIFWSPACCKPEIAPDACADSCACCCGVKRVV